MNKFGKFWYKIYQISTKLDNFGTKFTKTKLKSQKTQYLPFFAKSSAKYKTFCEALYEI